jgi:DNA (cytosine-5)-methyltransferase 1
MKPHTTKKNSLKYLELFAGIGGFRSAIENASKHNGIQAECIGYSEIDANAIKTYKANFGVNESELEIGDINSLDSELKIKKLPKFDVLLAGFPCQPFSLMGEKEGFADSRGTMFFQIAKILEIKKPEFFILENVRGLKTHDGGKTFERIMQILTEDLDYNVRPELFNSADFGVPQVRRRLYFIGVKNKKTFGQISHLDFSSKVKKNRFQTAWHLLEREVDEKYYLSEKLIKTILAHGSGNYYSKSEINRILARPLTASMHKMHRANQDNYYSDDFIHGEFDGEKVIPGTRSKKRIRKLTPLEAFRLQGFNDSFVVKAQKAGVSDTQLYKQAGNAITVNVAETILKTILKESQLFSDRRN